MELSLPSAFLRSSIVPAVWYLATSAGYKLCWTADKIVAAIKRIVGAMAGRVDLNKGMRWRPEAPVSWLGCPVPAVGLDFGCFCQIADGGRGAWMRQALPARQAPPLGRTRTSIR